MEQPCLKHNGPTPGFDNSNPRPVCTFCLASMKKMVRYCILFFFNFALSKP